MKKAIVLLMILMMVCTIVAATPTPTPPPTPTPTTTQSKLPAGWEYSSDGTKIIDKSNNAVWHTYDRQPNNYYTRTYGGGDYKSEYNPQTGTRLDYNNNGGLWTKTQVAYYNEGGYVKSVTSSNPSFGEALDRHKQNPAATPTPAPSSTPAPATTPTPSASTTPAPSPTPTPSPTPSPAPQQTTGMDNWKYDKNTDSYNFESTGHTFSPDPDRSGQYRTAPQASPSGTYYLVYDPAKKMMVQYDATTNRPSELYTLNPVTGNPENTISKDVESSPEWKKFSGQPAPGPAEQPGEKPAEGAPAKEPEKPAEKTPEKPAEGAPTKEEKPVEGKPEEPEGTDAPIIPRVGGPNAKGGTTANPSGEPQYYVDKDGNIYGKPGKGREPAPPAVVEAAKTYGGVASRNGNTYTFAEQVDVDDGLEADYRTTTTVSITDNGEEGYTRTVDQTTDERTGLLERGEWKYKERTTVSTGIGKATNEEGKSINVMTGQAYTSYDKSGKPTSISTVNYKYDPKWEKVYQTGASVDRVDDKGNTYPVWSMGEDKTEKYYKDKDGKEYKLTSEEKKAIEKEKVRSVNNGMQGLNAFYKLGLARSLGRFMKAYDEYAGLRQYSAIGGQAYDQQVQERRAKIQQEFCIATGTRNCIVSKICEQKFDIVPGDTMAGRGPGGQFVTSARINGKRSLAVELEGLSRQQLIDMFGNLTVVAGRRINLTDPKFNPKTLEKLKLRLYHIQFLITNNADKHELSYNIKFKRSEPGSTSSYGTPVKEAKWYPADKKLEKGATTTDEIYKWSPGEYTDVCLTFSPPLPSGSITGKPKMVNEFCVPFKEDYEGPTTIAATLQEAMAQGEQEQVTGVAGELV